MSRLPADLANFFVRSLDATSDLRSPRKDLLRLFLVKLFLSFFPMSLPAATDAGHYAGADYDRVSGPRLLHYLRKHARMLEPRRLLGVACDVNAGVLPGKGSMSKGDVCDFLAQTSADVVYLDPPYGGTTSYESAFAVLDQMLGDSQERSEFSGKRPPLDALIAACSHIPVMVLSANESVLSAEECRDLVARHRSVRRVLKLPYRHFGAIASPEKNATNREVLILGVRE